MKRLYLLIFLLLMSMSVDAQTPMPNITCQMFPSNHIFNTRLDTLLASGHIQVDARNNTWLNNMGRTRSLRPDFGETVWPPGTDQIIGMPYNVVDADQPTVDIEYYLYGDESDPGQMPIPPTALREGGQTVTEGDRHVFVVEDESCFLYELWYAYKNPDNSWSAGSGAVYDLTSNWLRPDGWTSADAAGLPILPFLPRYEEIQAGSINHAIRFTLSQSAEAYVWPARHAAGSQPISQYPPMGQIFLLDPAFDTSDMSPEGQIIAEAMKRYGIILADNGSSGYVSGTHDSRWNIENLLDDLGLITFDDFVAVDICKLRVDPNSGEAAINANPGGTGCTRNEGFSVSGGYAQGRVLDPAGNPLAGITVHAGGFQSQVTDATGTYLIDEIPLNQNFVLSADGSALGLSVQWWENADTVGGATTLQLHNDAPSVYRRDFTLGQLDTLSGTVYASNGTSPLPNIPVYVDGQSSVVCTDSNGAYSLELVVGVPYRIGAGGSHPNCTDDTHVLRWYPDAHSAASGDDVIVAEGGTSGINFILPDVVAIEMNEQLFLAELQAASLTMDAVTYPLLVDVVNNGAVITMRRGNTDVGTATISINSDNGFIRVMVTQTTGGFTTDISHELPEMIVTAFDSVLQDVQIEQVMLTASAIVFQVIQ